MATQKTALVTGCTVGGIGHYLATELHRRGFKVFATGRTLEKVSDLKELGLTTVALTVDDRDSVARCHREVVKTLNGQGLDYLFNNAGLAVYRPATETDFPELQRMFGSNVFGVIDMVQTFLPELLKAKGHIINIGSVAGQMPLPFMSTYAASKAAIHAYSESLRIELAPLGVSVTYTQTGGVKTHKIPTRHHLDENSRYYSIRETYEKEQENAATSGTEGEVFARDLVGMLEGRKKDGGTVWVGEGAVMCRVVSLLEWWLPVRLWPFILSKMYGLDQMGKRKKED